MKKYGLDLTDRKILYELDLNSRITFKQLAKKLNIAKETAAFRIKRLKKNNYINNFITIIHPSNLNRFYYRLFYKFNKTTPEIEKQIIEFIKNYNSTSYLASLEGRYDITVLILSKNMEDLHNFLVPFREKFGDYILEQEILIIPTIHRFNFRFFYDGKAMYTTYPKELVEPDIDKVDYDIIKHLAENSRISLIELANITKTETNVIKYRIKKLKTSDILGNHVLDINFEKFGMQQIQVYLSLKDHNSINKIITYVSKLPESTFATVMLGKYDLELEFIVENMKELRNIINKIKENFSTDINDHDVFIVEEHSINWFPYKMEKSDS